MRSFIGDKWFSNFYISIIIDTTKDYLSNEANSKQNTSYCSAKQDVSGLCLNKEGEIECELLNQTQTQNYASQEVTPPVHLKSNVCKQNIPHHKMWRTLNRMGTLLSVTPLRSYRL